MTVKMLMASTALIGAIGFAPEGFGATVKKTIPNTITTTDGKTYQMTRLVSAPPDGLVVQYRPEEGGVGLRLIKFRNLPEDLRREFNYNEDAARQHEANRAEALAQWRENMVSPEPSETAPGEQQETLQASPRAYNESENYPVGRFRAEGTIRGAMIVDTVTGESWLVDLHSVLNDYQDRSYFLEPKISLPALPAPKAVVIGP